MVNKNFELQRVKNQILKTGIVINVFRNKLNEFNELIDENELSPMPVCEFDGVFFEQKSTSSTTTSDGNVFYRTSKIPTILCLYEDVKDFLKEGDYLYINDKKFIISNINNFQQWNAIYVIDLQEVN